MKKLICIVTAICTLALVGCETNNNKKVSLTSQKKVCSIDSLSKKDVPLTNKKVETIKNETTFIDTKVNENEIETLELTDTEPNLNVPVNIEADTNSNLNVPVNIEPDENSNVSVNPKPDTKPDVKPNSNAPVNIEPETKPNPEPVQNIYPSEDEIMNLIQGAENVLNPIFKGPALFSKSPLVINNLHYGEVTNFNSREEMASSLRGYFTEDVINNMLDKYLLEKDGKLYFVIGQAGIRVNYNSCTKNFAYDGNTITATVSYKYSDSENGVVTETKTLQLIDGQWLFTNFWYI